MNLTILRIAVPSPLRSLFDYLPPVDGGNFQPGQRIKIPFGRSKKIGLLIEVASESEFPLNRLKPAIAQLDSEPLWNKTLFKLIAWASGYYHHPIGEVFASAMPVLLKQGKEPRYRPEPFWHLSEEGRIIDPQSLKRAPKQLELFQLLKTADHPIAASLIKLEVENHSAPLKRLEELGLIVQCPPPQQALSVTPSPHSLNSEQQNAVTEIIGSRGSFQAHLLDGVTGSGKTEVYLQAMAPVLEAGRAVLVLVPEIGLTPQLVERFRERLSCSIGLLHSGLADGERLQTWLAAKAGDIQLLIGTRSAIFTPFENLGMIIVDEEHDPSFKQQDGFRYSARDVAVKRAHLEQIPIVLGSGTPSIETLYHAREGRYSHLKLTERAGGAMPPKIHLLDVRHHRMTDGLSQPLLKAIRRELEADNQVLIFLNRRGFAPALLCYDCGWSANCHRCDSLMTLYAGLHRLRCHHCGLEAHTPTQCPSCQSENMHPVGEGTERLEQALLNHFPESEILRIDRDTTRRKSAFEDLINRAK
ncbi:MAG: primosomal protein N', partial [Gammaproteobacteria bacterium]|nr:primosomal protein N' [Gammaproteobacteria bacterium]